MNGSHHQARLGSFVGTSRFSILRELGMGGGGVVYEALDRERDCAVALKVLRAIDPDSLFRFKREFRDFRDLTHPNLVTLHELHVDNGVWFFTMDLVDGPDFLTWVRPEGAIMLERLRDGLEQLTRALIALHDVGKVHRDVKPSNIKVTAEGRIVLLDFGIASVALRQSTSSVFGTLAYMAPEQALGEAVGGAADWYATGALLYEALTGQLPCDGPPHRMLMNKLLHADRHPSCLASDVPAELDQLCAAMLERRPELRPSGRAVLHALTRQEPVVEHAGSFIGRTRELGELGRYFEHSKERFCAVTVVGEAGVGKSALVRKFVELLTEQDAACLVLWGHCDEREQLPFQAVDGLVDWLSTYLRRQPADQVHAMMPENVSLLLDAFPVLGRVPAIAKAPPAEGAVGLRERREMLFEVLRQLLVGVSRQRRVIVVLDDVQWLDADSMALLSSVLREPGAPQLLLLASERSEAGSVADVVPGTAHVQLERLLPEDALALAQCLIGDRAFDQLDEARSLATSADGHPLFLQMLVGSSSRTGDQVFTLEQALLHDIQELPSSERALLELVCVSAVPLSAELASLALSVPRVVVDAGARTLSGRHLLKRSNKSKVEPYHGLIQTIVVAQVQQHELGGTHERLARALQSDADADPEPLVHHFAQAGHAELAAQYAERAAQKAVRLLAFDRAIYFFERCLALAARPTSATWAQLGDAFVNVGRGANAARAYLRAADGADTALFIDLQRRAAQAFLRAGHVDEGLAALQEVLGRTGLRLMTPTAATTSLLWSRFRLAVRGLQFAERPAHAIAADEIKRLDNYSAAIASIMVVDPVQAAALQTRQLIHALRAGEPSRIVHGLCMHALFTAAAGTRSRSATESVIARARALAERLSTPAALSMVAFATGASAFLNGDWHNAQRLCGEAARMLRDKCVGATWEMDSASWWELMSAYWTGNFESLRRRALEVLSDAESRGDLYAVVNLKSMPIPMLALLDDEPSRARAEVETAIRLWSQHGFHVQHFNAHHMMALIDLYEGKTESAACRMVYITQALRRSPIAAIQSVRVWGQHLQAIVDLRTGNVEHAARMARLMEREDAEWARALALCLRACIAPSRDRTERWQTAADALTASGLHTRAACARWYAGDPAGEQWLKEQGVRNPQALIGMVSPCSPD